MRIRYIPEKFEHVDTLTITHISTPIGHTPICSYTSSATGDKRIRLSMGSLEYMERQEGIYTRKEEEILKGVPEDILFQCVLSNDYTDALKYRGFKV